jgi:hypothetical protein
MRVAIDFHDQMRFPAIEISDVWPDGMLPPKFESEGIAFEPSPQGSLRRGHIATETFSMGLVAGRTPGPITVTTKRARPRPA